MKAKPILVLGHPRSGTSYMAKLMQSFGIDIRHEKMGKHGISDWMFAVRSDDKPWGKKSNINTEFNHIIHIHPNPWRALNSVSFKENLAPKSVAFRRRFINLPESYNIVDIAVESLIEWNELIEKWHPDLTVAVGNAKHKCYEYLTQQGFSIKKPDQLPELGNVNSRERYDLPPSEMLKLMSFPYREKFLKYADKVMALEKGKTT